MRKLTALMGLLFLLSCTSALAQDTISFQCQSQNYQGVANFTVTIDGKAISSATNVPCTALNTGTSWQSNSYSGSWGGTGIAHKIVITFPNWASGGSAGTNRNLYVKGVTFDSIVGTPTATVTLYSGNPPNNATWSIPAGTPPPSPPVITTQPISQIVNNGQTATFTVGATGASTYQWQKNGIEIVGATTPSYTDTQATSADSGSKFTVMLSNAAGNTISNSATLTVRTTATLDNGNSTFTTTLAGYDNLTKCPTVACISTLGSVAGVPTLGLTVTTIVTHTVAMTWSQVTTCTDGTNCPASSYNIYRGQTNGGPYSKIGSSQTVSYTDATVASGQTYYYVVTAIVATSNPPESGYSNQAQAVVPTP